MTKDGTEPMLNDQILNETFDDMSDVIEVNGCRQEVTDCGGDPLWMACIEAINHSGIKHIPFAETRALDAVLNGIAVVRGGDVRVFKLTVIDERLN